MKVTVTLSEQQLTVLRSLAERLEPGLRAEELVARAFGEYCRDHPELAEDADAAG